MKKIIFILILTMGSIYAKPCMTDIYFGNGVWNTRDEGEQGMYALRAFMQKNSLTIEDEKNKLYSFKHAHNPSGGTTDDLIETFYQLKESGQISYGYFTWMVAMLNIDGQTDINTKLQDIIRTHNDDAIYMFTKYDNESFSKKHNVLLVAHSQGNLFGNKMYTLMNDAQKEKFRMVSVATPADYVSGGGPYVTASGDYVIVPISGSLPANVIGFGHTFLGTYLNMDGVGVPGDGSNSAPPLIASYVKTAYNNLLQTTSCNEYWAINMTLHSEGYMEILAYPILNGREIFVGDSLGTVDFKPFPHVVKKDANGNIIEKCNVNPNIVKYWGDIDLCYTNTTADTCGWKAGEIYSKSTLEARKNLSYTMLSKDYTKCINISHSGEVYELIKDIFE